MTISPNWRRGITAAVVATAVTVAPAAALFGAPRGWPDVYDGVEVFFFYLPLMVGSFVFATLERPRPEWWHAVAFAFVVSVVGATFMMIRLAQPSGDFGHGALELSLFGFLLVLLGVMLGMAGSGIASVASRPLRSFRRDGAPRRLKPWNLGVAVALVELAAAAVFAVV
jgi:hypothetical protein